MEISQVNLCLCKTFCLLCLFLFPTQVGSWNFNEQQLPCQVETHKTHNSKTQKLKKKEIKNPQPKNPTTPKPHNSKTPKLTDVKNLLDVIASPAQTTSGLGGRPQTSRQNPDVKFFIFCFSSKCVQFYFKTE